MNTPADRLRPPPPLFSLRSRSRSRRVVWASEEWIAEHGTHSLQEAQMGTPLAQELTGGGEETIQQPEGH